MTQRNSWLIPLELPKCVAGLVALGCFLVLLSSNGFGAVQVGKQEDKQEAKQESSAVDEDPALLLEIPDLEAGNLNLSQQSFDLGQIKFPSHFILPQHHLLRDSQSPLEALKTRLSNQTDDLDKSSLLLLAGTLYSEPYNAYLQKSELDIAVSLWDRWILDEHRNSKPEDMLEESSDVRNSPDTERAIEADQSPGDQDPPEAKSNQRKVAVTFAIRGRVLYSLGVFDLALEDLNKSLTWHDDATVKQWKADCLYQMARFEEVIKVVDSLDESVRSQPGMMRDAVMAHVGMGNFDVAYELMENAKLDTDVVTEFKRVVQAEIKNQKKRLQIVSENKLDPVTDQKLKQAVANVNALSEKLESSDRDEALLSELKTVNFGQLQRQQWVEAAATYRQRIEISQRSKKSDKEISGLYRSRSQVLLTELGQRKEALSDLQEALRLDMENGQSWLLMSSMLLGAGQFEKAAEAASLSIEYMKREELPFNRPMEFLAAAKRHSGELALAFELMVRAATEDLQSSLAMLELCEICSDPGFVEQVAEAMTESTDNVDAQANWIEQTQRYSQLHVGRMRVLLEVSTRLILSGHHQGHRFRAEALTVAGLTELALSDARAVVASGEASVQDWSMFTGSLVALGRLDEAFEASEQATKTFPTEPKPIAVLGQVHAVNGEYDKALEFFDKASGLLKSENAQHQDLRGFILQSRAEVWLLKAGNADGDERKKLIDKALQEFGTILELQLGTLPLRQQIEERIRGLTAPSEEPLKLDDDGDR